MVDLFWWKRLKPFGAPKFEMGGSTFISSIAKRQNYDKGRYLIIETFYLDLQRQHRPTINYTFCSKYCINSILLQNGDALETKNRSMFVYIGELSCCLKGC